VFSSQHTILKKIVFSGVGLHSGNTVNIILIPEKKDSGINFIFKNNQIKASWKNAEISQLCTKIKKKDIRLSTIEHLMSALSGLGITNLSIQISSDEVPILDGSAKEFYEKILEIGLVNQKVPQKIINIKKKIMYKENGKFIQIEPNNHKKLIVDCTIDFKDEFVKKQHFKYEHSFENYKDIYKARTFCFHKDLEKIFAMGLAKGGSLDNAIVVSGNKILNQGGLRYKNEFVKHKVLDCIGDLYLAEFQIYGNVKSFGGGHELNLMLLKEIFRSKDNFELI